MSVWTIIGLLTLIYVTVTFVKSIGKGVPIPEVMLLIAGLQWILGPFIEYLTPSLHYKYYMYVPQNEYMSYVVPAYILFTFALLNGTKKVEKLKVEIFHLEDYSNFGLKVFIVGVVFDFIGGYLPGSLKFFGFLVANFKYIGAIILFFSKEARHRMVLYFCIAYLFVSSVAKGLFHDLVLWSLFFFLYWAIQHRPSIKTILALFFAGIISLSTLQGIKSAYRSKIWEGYNGNKLSLFSTLFVDALFSKDEVSNEKNDVSENVRMNQGWIISAIMYYTPAQEPFAHGGTIYEAISSSLLPRFIAEDKKKAGGQENFRRFTGLDITDSTSMGMSLVGEGYANYGVLGGILFMGLWGLAVAKVWVWLLRKSVDNMVYIAFIPMIFLQVIKAETEFATVLNHLFKASVVVFGFVWAAQNVLKWKVKNED